MKSENIRVREADRALLKRFKETKSVREQAVEEGVLDHMDAQMSYKDVLKLMIPDDAETMERSEEDEMGWITAGEDNKETILELAGENVSVHEVINHFAEQFAEQHNIQHYNE